MLYIIPKIYSSYKPLTSISPFNLHSTPGNHCSLPMILFYFFRFHVQVRSYIICLSVWLNIMSSVSSMLHEETDFFPFHLWICLCIYYHLSIYLDSDAGKDWRQEEKGTTENEIVGCLTYSMDMSLSKLQELMMDSEAWHAAVRWIERNQTSLSDWNELIYLSVYVTSSLSIYSWTDP